MDEEEPTEEAAAIAHANINVESQNFYPPKAI